MRKLSTCIHLLLLCAMAATTYAQDLNTDPTERGGAYPLSANDADHPCVSPAQYEYIERECNKNIARLGLNRPAQRSTTSKSLSWPLKETNGLSDCGYYRIAAYVDEDTTSGIKDWNCGTNTYNTHRGTDIATYPYPFFKMDNSQVEVIAAAPGTILFKSDTSFDKNCASNSSQANFIVIQHADGTLAYYFHMKKHSVSTKNVGQTVVLGEYLGIVGSSGDATGPHLHFEVRTSIANTDFKDPWSGSCNHLNANSWWASQKPYTEPAIVLAQVGITDPIFPVCPLTETPNSDTCIPAGGAAKFYAFFRNETSGTTANFRVIKPDGTTLSSWTHASVASYAGSYYSYTRTMPATPGAYIFQTVYNGDTCSKLFHVACGATTAVASTSDAYALTVYPNPTAHALHVDGSGMENGSYRITMKNLLGQIVYTENIKVDNNAMQKTLSVSDLPDAVYFLTIESERSVTVRKIEKRD